MSSKVERKQEDLINKNSKKPFFQNVGSFLKNTLSNKVGNLFKKNTVKINTANPEANKPLEDTSKKTENKQIFKIEEDEDAKEYSYHLNEENEEEDEYEEMEDEEENQPKSELKNKIEEESKSSPMNHELASTGFSSKIETSTPEVTQDINNNIEEDDGLDVYNMCHRIYYKVKIMIKFNRVL